MNYNNRMVILLSALLLLSGPAKAADSPAPAAAATASKETIELVNYFLKVELADANSKLIDPFLAVKIETLPKKLQNKAAAKQVEVAAVIRIHTTKKKGIFVQPPVEECSETSFVKPLSMAGFFPAPGYEEVTDDELACVMEQTKCTEIDLGCRFSLLIFFEKKKDRILKFNAIDPMMAIVAGCRGKAGTTHFFGAGYSCMH
jgi:hypothetical protein